MTRVKDMLALKKAIIQALGEVGKTQNEIAIQIGCSQSAISKIRTFSKWSNCSSKLKTIAIDEHE